jgi:hypothetical protein
VSHGFADRLKRLGHDLPGELAQSRVVLLYQPLEFPNVLVGVEGPVSVEAVPGQPPCGRGDSTVGLTRRDPSFGPSKGASGRQVVDAAVFFGLV